MRDEEYQTIMKLLNDNKIDDLKKYLDSRINSKYYKSVQKIITEFINNNCDIEYPSYYQRTQHQGIRKYYRGLYIEIDDGFVISPNSGNVFQLYDRSVLTPKISEALKNSYRYHDEEERIKIKGGVIKLFSKANEIKSPLHAKKSKEGIIVAGSTNGTQIMVPEEYYEIAQKILGNDTTEYITNFGMYFDSPRGKALVMRMERESY